MDNRTILTYNRGDRIIDISVNVLIFLMIVVTLTPVLYIISISFSSAQYVEKGEVWLYPKGLTLTSYKLILAHPFLVKSFMNSVFYVTTGTAYSLFLTILGAYALSRRRLPGRNFFMFMIAFTMLFGGGLIPTYILVNSLGMVNHRVAMILPMAVGVWNLVIVRTMMMQIPDSLEESAKMDGANDYQILFRIILPMSIATVTTVGLFYLVGKWNDFFRALIYLNDKDLYPLQLIVRELIIAMSDFFLGSEMAEGEDDLTPQAFRAAVMVFTMLPLLILYPFVQKYFVKGIMIGSIKG